MSEEFLETIKRKNVLIQKLEVSIWNMEFIPIAPNHMLSSLYIPSVSLHARSN